MAISNVEFGRRAGYHFSMASRILSGDRLPSAHGLMRIADAFDLDKGELMEKFQEGAEPLGAYLRKHCHSKDAQTEAAGKASGTVSEKLGAGKQ